MGVQPGTVCLVVLPLFFSLLLLPTTTTTTITHDQTIEEQLQQLHHIRHEDPSQHHTPHVVHPVEKKEEEPEIDFVPFHLTLSIEKRGEQRTTLEPSDYHSSYHLTKQVDTCDLQHSLSYNVSRSHLSSHPPSVYDYPPKESVKFKCNKKCYGLGDVLKGVVSTALLAIVSNHQFKLEIKHPPLHNFYNYPPFVSPEPQGKSISVRSYNKQNLKRLSRVTNGTLYEQDKSYSVQTNANYIKYLVASEKLQPKLLQVFHTLDREVIFGCLTRYILNPSPRLLSLAATVLEGVKDEVLIGVHVRTGDTISKRTPVELIERFFDCYREHLGDKAEEYYTYLAVDKAAMYELAEKRFNSSKLLTYPNKGPPGHSDRSCKGQCEIVRERTVIEHFVLSRVDSLLASRSGFSNSAAQIGGQYGFVLLTHFCDCVKGRSIEDFMEIRDGRRIPIWNRDKCEKFNPNSTYGGSF